MHVSALFLNGNAVILKHGIKDSINYSNITKNSSIMFPDITLSLLMQTISHIESSVTRKFYIKDILENFFFLDKVPCICPGYLDA